MRMMTLTLQATQRITTLCDRHQFVRNKRRKRDGKKKRERGRQKLSHIKRPDAISSYQSRAECTVGPNGSRSFAYFTFICFRRLIGSIFIAFKLALLDTWHIYTALSIDMYRQSSKNLFDRTFLLYLLVILILYLNFIQFDLAQQSIFID